MPRVPVSVVIPTFNRERVIERCLRSVLRQSTPPEEIIVSDDASTDDTVSIATALGVSVLRHERNRGSGPTRNDAIAAASQPWIAFIDSDDEWEPNHLASLWAHHDKYQFLATTAQEVTDDVTLGRLRGCGTDHPIALMTPADFLIPENRVVTSTTLVRKDLINAVGAFRDFRRAQDLDLWLRVAERASGVILPDVTIRYHLGADQASNDIDLMRTNVMNILSSHRDARWNTPALRTSAQTQDRWDAFRGALRNGHRVIAVRRALWFAAHPQALPTLRALLRHRKNIRARSVHVLSERSAEPRRELSTTSERAI